MPDFSMLTLWGAYVWPVLLLALWGAWPILRRRPPTLKVASLVTWDDCVLADVLASHPTGETELRRYIVTDDLRTWHALDTGARCPTAEETELRAVAARHLEAHPWAEQPGWHAKTSTPSE